MKSTRQLPIVSFVLWSVLAAVPAASAQTLTTLYSFTGGGDGAYPSSLIRDSAGNLYRVANGGGSPTCPMPNQGCGTIFKLDTKGNLRVLYRFMGGTDGSYPAYGLMRDSAGNLYGTTFYGGDPNCAEGAGYGPGCGTVYKLDSTGHETVLYAFHGNPDGAGPEGGLVEDAAGNFYGVTGAGGSCSQVPGCGTVFKIDKTGAETVLYSFNGGFDGYVPRGVVRDPSGVLYGTTAIGGAHYVGTAFKVTQDGTETVLHNFQGGADGQEPSAGPVWDASILYGITTTGGANFGTIFKTDKSGREQVVYAFQGPPDGSYPAGTLTRDAAGNLYGTTFAGGFPTCFLGIGCGTVFKLDTSGHETVLYSFTNLADGNTPLSGVIRDSAGTLYGTTYSGGAYGYGTIFKLEP
jgi:uncharacterized repeat protein (TIGR03803 family)